MASRDDHSPLAAARVGARRPGITSSTSYPCAAVESNGTCRNLTLKLDGLLTFQAYSDGFALEKASGKSPHFSIDGDAELANVILGTALAHC